MSLDNETGNGIVPSVSTETSVTADSGSPAPAATSNEGAQSSAEAAASTGPADAATQTSTDTGSSTAPNTTLQSATQAEDPAVWKQRYGELRKREQSLTQQFQQAQQRMQQFEGVDPSAVRQWQEANKQAQAQNLPPWNRNHPANGRFTEAKVRWQQFKQAMSRAETPEQKQWIQQTVGGQFHDDDLRAIQAWEQHQRQFSENFASDPEGAIGDIVERRVQQALSQHMEQTKASTSVDTWFQDPANKQLIDSYRGEMVEMLQSGAPWKFVQKHIQIRAQADGLQSRVGDADRAKAAAAERDRLLKGNAAVTRDPKSPTVVDPMSVARERKIQPGTTEYLDLLRELKANGNLPE